MTWFEIILMIKEYTGSTKEAIEIANEMLVDIDSKKAVNELAIAIENLADSNEVCPLCGSELQYIKDGEQKSEYFGSLASETIGHYECEDSTCGFTRE